MSDYDRFANARAGAGVAGSGAAAIDQGLRAYMIGVYNYMTLGLGLTGLVSYGAYSLAGHESATGRFIADGPLAGLYHAPLSYVVMLAPLGLVMYISAARNSMSVGTARATFLAFAALMGLSMSAIFLVFTKASIANVFFETAAAFAGLSLYGYTTRRSLSAMGSFMAMGLIGLIIAMVVNNFLQSSGLQWALSVIGILIFAGLTAWDTQSIKESYFAGDAYEASEKKAIYGALRLYLDFINMFQFLLQMFGDRR